MPEILSFIYPQQLMATIMWLIKYSIQAQLNKDILTAKTVGKQRIMPVLTGIGLILWSVTMLTIME